MKIQLGQIAHARSGDKGNLVNIGVSLISQSITQHCCVK